MKNKDKEFLREVHEVIEGREYGAYRDSGGVLTIGIGHANQATQRFDEDSVWDDEIIDAVWEKDLQTTIDLVDTWVDFKISDDWYLAIVDLVYNTGARPTTILSCLREGDEDGAIKSLVTWIYCNKVALLGLIKRRLAWVAYLDGYDVSFVFDILEYPLNTKTLDDFNKDFVSHLGFEIVKTGNSKKYKVEEV